MTIKERSVKFLSDSQKNQKDPNNSKKEKFRELLDNPKELATYLAKELKKDLDRES